MEKNAYSSCIKIKGIPILPPLISPNRRKELLEYKHRAIELENLYLKKKLDRRKSLESNLVNSISDNLNLILKDIESPIKYVPYEEEKTKLLSLSRSLIEVSEYTSSLEECRTTEDESQELISSAVESYLPYTNDVESAEKLKTYQESSSCFIDLTSVDSINDKKESERPRLIRSNSYTLDNPSPLLLAHLNRERSISSSTEPTESYSTESIATELFTSSKGVTSDCIISLNQENECNYHDQIGINKTNLNPMEIVDLEEIPLNQSSLEFITTDIKVHQINIITPIKEDLKNEDVMEMFNTEKDDNLSIKSQQNMDLDPKDELEELLKEIPENYSKKIIELIEKQKLEQKKRIQNYENTKRDLLQSLDQQNNEMNRSITPKKIFVKSKSNSLEQPIIMSQYDSEISTIQDVSDAHRPRSSTLNENHFLNSNISIKGADDFSLKKTQIFDLANDKGKIDYKTCEELNIVSNNKNEDPIDNFQFRDPKIIEKELRKAKEKNAANIIVAYAKGYLVRRLMKIAKVQEIILTIKEALECAIELQNSEVIEEVDVEYHRRLIAQVSAACYAFYDVFFDLTISEQMNLISLDREKQRKLLTIKPISSRPNSNSKRRSKSNVRLSKSLTKF